MVTLHLVCRKLYSCRREAWLEKVEFEQSQSMPFLMNDDLMSHLQFRYGQTCFPWLCPWVLRLDQRADMFLFKFNPFIILEFLLFYLFTVFWRTLRNSAQYNIIRIDFSILWNLTYAWTGWPAIRIMMSCFWPCNICKNSDRATSEEILTMHHQ